MASTIQIRVDDDLKNQRLEQSRESSKKGNYRNADDVISDMRGKYGLPDTI